MDFNIHVIPDFHSLIAQLLASLVLFLVLRYFLFKPVNELLKKRKEYIENGVKKSEEVEQKLMQIDKEYDERMLKAKKESSEIISKARLYGDDIKNKAVQESKELAKVEYEKGMKKLENEKQKLMKNINNEIIDMALAAASKVIKDKVDKDYDKQMLKSLIDDMEKKYE